MKKHLSSFGLFARSSIFKVLGIIIVLSIVEILVFHQKLQETLETYNAIGRGMLTLEKLFSYAATNVFFRVALVLISVVICLPGCEFKSHTGYTLRRLSVSERATFFHQATYNIFVYLILLAVQLIVAFGLANYYVASVPAEYITNQTIALAFYRNGFLHSLLPLEDISLWIRNGLLVLSLGLATATFPYQQRRRKFSATAIALILYTIVRFDQGIGELLHTITTGIIALMIIGEVIYHLTRKEEEGTKDA